MAVFIWRTHYFSIWNFDLQMKKKSTLLKEQKRELRYWQGVYRMELWGIQLTKDKIKEIAKEMRKIHNS